ncbi:MAG: glycosyltransferase [Acidimicrobiales bacterium]
MPHSRWSRRAGQPATQRLPRIAGRPNVLTFIVSYPTFSETYMHEELRALRHDVNFEVITYKPSTHPRRQPFEHQVIPYPESCPVYGKWPDVNSAFDSPAQQEFIERIDEVIDRFRPDMLHAHYFGMVLLLRHLARRHEIPFTVRTHSMDVLNEPPEKLDELAFAANSRWCRRVLAFPHSRRRLINHGLDPAKIEPCWPVVDVSRFRHHRKARRRGPGAVMCAGPAIHKKAHNDFVDLAATAAPNRRFDLYAAGPDLHLTEAHNQALGNPVTISYVDPSRMHRVYPHYEWLVYPSDPVRNKVGLPVSIAEAQAAGVGVVWRELPGRRDEQLEFLGDGGFLYNTLDELHRIIADPYPETMRRAGYAAAERCDVQQHKHLLSDVWTASVRGLAPSA